MTKRVFVTIVIATLITSCTTKQLYNSAKGSKEAKCRQHVGNEREQCMQEVYKKTYEEYERERQQVLKGETDR